MSDSIDEDQFKTPGDKFIQDLDVLEYNNCDGGNVARMSLYKQFDPLVEQNNSITTNTSGKSPTVSVHVPNPLNNNNNNFDKNDENLNQSGTLIHLNNTIENNGENMIDDKNASQANGDHNYPVDDSNNLHNQQIVQMNEEIGNLESKNENLELLIGKLALINEIVVNSSILKISKFQEIVDNREEEISKLSLIKNQLEEDMNGVEKSYYEIHSRYDHLRSLVKEMDQKESQNKTRIQELSQKLKEKDLECRKMRMQAEEAIENANQRMQTASNNETISLKAQIKVLEMRVNSLQSQIEQKNIENQELSNIVNELIAPK